MTLLDFEKINCGSSGLGEPFSEILLAWRAAEISFPEDANAYCLILKIGKTVIARRGLQFEIFS